MAKIKWTFEAVSWLENIYHYIEQDNPAIAQNVVSSIYEKAQILEDHPQIGYLHKLETEGEIRILLYGHYRITYLVKNNKDIDIIGVFHGAMDIEKYIP